MLVDLLTHEPQILMEPDLHLTVRIPGPSGDYDIESLPGMLSRVSVIEWHPDHKPAAMRATFIFHDLAQTHHDQIEQVLQLALEDDLEKTDTD
ncbi:MAG: hypothetical protein HKP58_17630 [Desulfatitalea sp.]|nr:hypothetical protein [Desulfatitalea sp.]NNK02236.1 hypothetical protein [Desulfatitalea sp.]